MIVKRKKIRKANKSMMFALLAFLFLAGLTGTSIIKNSILIISNKQQINELNNKYKELLGEEESLISEVTKLQDEEYIARYAREKYMYSLPGEYIIRLPKEE